MLFVIRQFHFGFGYNKYNRKYNVTSTHRRGKGLRVRATRLNLWGQKIMLFSLNDFSIGKSLNPSMFTAGTEATGLGREQPGMDIRLYCWDNTIPLANWYTTAILPLLIMSLSTTRFSILRYSIEHWSDVIEGELKTKQILNSQQTPHSSPSRASYGVSIIRNLEKIDPVLTAPQWIYKWCTI